ncbi:transposase [Spirosoma sp. BT702]|uniref:Transposase n=1 Tax=Spirosoma profusum TaxID=2771354 RepID=A0A926XUH1_9BACT|nr:transposase [Spirosoma profusum]MBD2700254.1 transposase [Spirosoma profusum]
MEQVLAVYQRPYNEQFPVVCVDESPKQLIEIRQYRSADGTRIEDSEYIRHGLGEIYMAFEALAGQRFVEVKDDHTAISWVSVMANLLDGPNETCVRMRVVGDNLSAHKPSAFYRVFSAEKAKNYLDRLEFVYTPKHGSWLDMAEIDLSILQRDCLNRHIATKELLAAEISVWQTKRNQKQAKANWQFTTKEARVRLHKLYPTT